MLNCGPSFPCEIEVGAVDGSHVWFFDRANSYSAYVGYIDASSGSVTAFSLGAFADSASGILAGPDGNFWFGFNKNVGRVTPSGTVTLFATKPAMDVNTLVTGPDGDLWFIGDGYGMLGRMSTSGKMLGESNIGQHGPPYTLLRGPDDRVWASTGEGLMRFSTPKKYTFLKIPAKYYDCVPYGLTIGSDAHIWFSSFATGGNYILCSLGIGTVLPSQ